MYNKTSERGFTILEMLTVIFIIGVLSAVVIVGLQSSREKARDDERVADLAMMGIALEQYYNACSRQYPQPDVTSGALTLDAHEGCPSASTITLRTFLKTLPKDPKDNTDYVYVVNGSPATNYVLQATFETLHRKLQDSVSAPTFYSAGCDTTALEYCVQP